MSTFTKLPPAPSAASPVRPTFTPEEIESIRNGKNGVRTILPARFYYDEDIYRWEVENILKKNWLFVGPWDWVEKPGDYFTRTMFGEPLVITRDKKGTVHCLVNSCRHRWAKVAPEGRGHASMLVCPYHHWTYNLDGTLRAMSLGEIPNVAKEDCALPKLRVEEWNGLIFINFDNDAAPLAPQLEELNEILKPYGLERFRSAGITTYDADWNYKFSFETGYEPYHHIGVHNDRIGAAMPPGDHRLMASGKLWGVYAFTGSQELADAGVWDPFGTPPWVSEEQRKDRSQDAIFVGIYPNFISFIQRHQISYITTQHIAVNHNISSTCIAIADWAHDRPNAAEHIAGEVKFMEDVQDEDTEACLSLEAGVRSKYNDRGFLHTKFEPWMTHYYSWMIDQYQK